MAKKNAMVQFHDGKRTVVNTGLLTLESAKDLFDAYISDFKTELERGSDPELVLWYPCKDENSYGDSICYLSSGTALVHDGRLFVEL